MRFIIVDDNNSFLMSLKFYLEDILKHEVIGLANNGSEFLELPYLYTADIIIIDVQMPVMGGIEAAKQALRRISFLKFIAVTTYRDNVTLEELLSAGFKGCVFKNDIYDELPKAIAKLSKGQRYFPGNIMVTNK